MVKDTYTFLCSGMIHKNYDEKSFNNTELFSPIGIYVVL